MFYEDINIDFKPVHKTKEPEKIVVEICDTLQQTNDSFHCFYCLWSYLQKQNGFDQIVPGFKGWMLEIRSLDQHGITKTVETYLTPTASKVTDFETMQQYLLFSDTWQGCRNAICEFCS